MIKTILTSLLSIFVLFVYSQSAGSEMQTYSFGDSSDNMMSKLSPKAKCFLSSVFEEYKVDTTSFYRVKYDEIFTKYTSKKYLGTHTYTYIRWSKTGKYQNSNMVNKMNGHTPLKPNKLIVLYSTDNKELEDMTIYIMN